MNKKTSRGLFPLLILLTALASGCRNPFFADLLGFNEEKQENGDSGTPRSYTVTFKSNYGSNDTLHTKTVTEPATTIAAADFPADPARSDYNFTGWNTQPDGGGGSFTASTTVSGDIRVYAQWTPIPPSSHTVTFKLNDGTDNNHAVKTVTSPANTVADFPADPTRNDYNFTGWNTQQNGGGGAFTASTTVDGDITVYAQWTAIPPNSYTVTFKLNDGTDNNHAVKTVTSPANTVADFPADPSRSDYNFVGWNTQQGGGGSAFDSSTIVSVDIRVYAQWTPIPPNSYTVTFKLNDGTDNNHAVKTVTSPANTVADFPADPARSDYNFAGWNIQQNGGGGAFTSSTTVDDDITVYAQWTANTGAVITLNFADAGDGAFSETTFTIYKSGGTGSRTVSVTGSGYTSPRWYVDGDPRGTGTSVTINAADYGAGSHVLTLIAAKDGLSWSKELSFTVEAGDLRTVIFRPNDGTGTIYATRTSTAGSVISGFPADPGRSGYDFVEWNTQPGGGGSPFSSSTPVNADITVYAQWNAKTYTVLFKSNDGADTTLYTETVTVPNTVISLFPADPDRTGYNFAGWNTQANGSGLAFGQSSAVQGNMTVYAQWAHEQFTIGINLDAGTGAFSETSFTVHKGGGTGSRTISLTGSGYTGPRWYVDGDLKASGPGSITINAADYGIGGHILTLFVSRSGVSWSKELPFTVEAGTLRTVIFRPNDDTGTIYAARTSAAGSVISGFPADPGRDGYDFAGWNTQAGGGGEPFTSSTAVPASPDTTTVYAQWTGKTYTVTFKSNDGADTTLYTETVIVPNTVISPFPVDPTRTGYNFAGWNTQANGSGTAFGQSSAVQGNMTVYAQWAHEQFTIGINLDAGTGAFNQSSFTIYKSGGTGTQTVAVTGSGYTNLRWYVDENIRGTGTSITINAADYGEGGHILTLFVSRSGVTWSKELSFTVNN